MNILGRMRKIQLEQEELNFKLSDTNTCVDMTSYRYIEDLWSFHSKIIYDVEGDMFCTLIATQDVDTIVREVLPEIEFFGEYDDVEINRDDEKLYYRFMGQLTAEDVEELTLAKLV